MGSLIAGGALTMASCMAHVYHAQRAGDRGIATATRCVITDRSVSSQPLRHGHPRRRDEAVALIEAERGILGPHLEMQRAHAERAELGTEQLQRRAAGAPVARVGIDPQLGEERIAPAELEVVAERDDRVADRGAIAVVALDEPHAADARIAQQPLE